MKNLLTFLLLFNCSVKISSEHQYNKKNDVPPTNSTPAANNVPPTNTAPPIKPKDLKKYFKKTDLFHLSAAAILIASNKDKILEFIKNHPFITVGGVIFLSKYMYDSYQKHLQLKEDFDILSMLQELYNLILYASEISNVMTTASASTNRSFNASEHFNQMVKDLPYSFDELERIAQHVLIKWKLRLKDKYPTLYLSMNHDRSYPRYTLDVDDTISFFYEHPIEAYQDTCATIATKIKIIMQNITKLHIFDSL